MDAAGNAYLTGVTDSPDLPVTNALQAKPGGGSDVFIAKLNGDGSTLTYATYFGGSGDERSFGIALDYANRASVIGRTNSQDMPTANSLQQHFGGGASDAFVAKLGFAQKVPFAQKVE